MPCPWPSIRGQEIVSFPWHGPLDPAGGPSNITCMCCVFWGKIVSAPLTVKAGLSTWKEKVVACWKTFLKEIETLEPELMMRGPWALGGVQVPCRGKTYSPPKSEEMVSRLWMSPTWQGSKCTVTLISVPVWFPAATLTFFSTVKFGLSVWIRHKISMECLYQRHENVCS